MVYHRQKAPGYVRPVSYAHLEVYKRQAGALPCAGFDPACLCGRGEPAVSYTHLKVVWPSKHDVKNNTITVIVVVLIAAVVLIALDLIFGGAIHLLIGA